MYGDYELTCGVTRMRAHQATDNPKSVKQQDLSPQCRCHAVPLRAAAAYEARMMAMNHHPQQRYQLSNGINFAPPSRT